MYVTSSNACNVPNSATPVTAPDVAAAHAAMTPAAGAVAANSAAGRRVNRAAHARARQAGQRNGLSYYGSAGGNSPAPIAAAASDDAIAAGKQRWLALQRARTLPLELAIARANRDMASLIGRSAETARATYPWLAPDSNSFTAARVNADAIDSCSQCACSGSEVGNAPRAVLPPPPAPPVAAMPARSQSECRTDNVCKDLLDGCVSQSQVSFSQLVACAEAGWSGNRNRYPWALVLPNLPFLGTPNPAPARKTGMDGLGCACEGGKKKKAAHEGCSCHSHGVGDLTDMFSGGPGSSIFWGSIGLGAAALWLAYDYGKKPRRR